MTHSPAPRPALHRQRTFAKFHSARKRPLLGTLLKALAAAFTIKNLLSYTLSRRGIRTLVSKDRNFITDNRQESRRIFAIQALGEGECSILLGAFSGKCETSRRFVDSSTRQPRTGRHRHRPAISTPRRPAALGIPRRPSAGRRADRGGAADTRVTAQSIYL